MLTTREIGLAVLFLASATAIVLPPDSSTSATSHSTEGIRPTIIYANRQRVEIPCPSCYLLSHHSIDYSENDDLASNSKGRRTTTNNIALDFSISKDGQFLELDDEAIYPSPRTVLGATSDSLPIYVSQTPADFELEKFSSEVHRNPLEVTSWGLIASSASAAAVGEGDATMRPIRVQLQVLGLEKQFMDLDEVVIELLQTSDGELMMVDVKQVPRLISPSHHHPSSEGHRRPEPESACAELPTFICNIKDFFSTTVQSLRNNRFGLARPPCGVKAGRPHHDPKFHEFDVPFPPPVPHQHSRPSHWRPHGGGHHHKHHRPHGLPTLTRGVIAILIPVMAGITTGLLVSLLGLFVGRMIGLTWIRISRLRQERELHRHCHAEGRSCSRGLEEVKVRLRSCCEKHAEMDPPPLYEHAPAYEDAPAYEEV